MGPESFAFLTGFQVLLLVPRPHFWEPLPLAIVKPPVTALGNPVRFNGRSSVMITDELKVITPLPIFYSLENWFLLERRLFTSAFMLGSSRVFATTRRNLEDIMGSEVSQTEEDRYCMMWRICQSRTVVINGWVVGPSERCCLRVQMCNQWIYKSWRPNAQCSEYRQWSWLHQTCSETRS